MLKNKSLFLIIFFLGIIAGFFLNKLNIFKTEECASCNKCYGARLLPTNSSDLINPLLRCETPPDGSLSLESLRHSLSEYINTNISLGNAASVSVYYKEYDTGDWFGINEEENYAPASLLKVPLMMTFLKEAEKDPAVLSKKIKYESEVNVVPQSIAPKNSLQLGNAYTVEELLRCLIVYSDNVSQEVLLPNIDKKLFTEIFSDLKLPVPDFKQEYKMSAKDFAIFFRILYNATYLNRSMSEKALRLLTKTEFQDGIVAGVPQDITIAHKFAERSYTTGEEKQLHDCGIVYDPKGPYLVCVMTRGSDFNKLKDIIKNISIITYEHKAKSGPSLY